MGSLLIRGKYVIARILDGNSSEIISDGAVYQEDGCIVDVGPYSELRAHYSPDEELGSTDHLVLPGLINAHHHVGLTPFQHGHVDAPLEIWNRADALVANPTLDTLYRGMQMIEMGVTTVVHNYSLTRGHCRQAARQEVDCVLGAYHGLGLRVSFSVMTRNQNPYVLGDNEGFLAGLPEAVRHSCSRNQGRSSLTGRDYLEFCGYLCEQYAKDPLVCVSISPQNVHWCSDDLLEGIRDFASTRNVRIHTHLQETIYQKTYGLRTYGKTPLAHLDELRFLGPDVDFAHGVWLTQSDIELLALSGCSVIHNPSSNLRLKSGIAPVNALARAGVRIAVGCDEAGINDDSDLLQEMRLVRNLHRVPGIGSDAPSSHQILKMATESGAYVAGFGTHIGVLAPGRRADVLVIDLRRIEEPYLHPDTNPVDALLYRGRGLDVNSVVVDGRVILRDRRFLHLDKALIHREIADWYSRQPQSHEIEREKITEALTLYRTRFYEEWECEYGEPYYRYNRRD